MFIILDSTQNMLTLKQKSVIPTTSFNGINQNIKREKEKEKRKKKSFFHFFFQVMHDYVCFIAPVDCCVE